MDVTPGTGQTIGNPLVKRMVDEIQKKWFNMTVSKKENLPKEKKNIQKTGRGVATSSMAQVGDHVPEIVGEDDPIQVRTVESDSLPVTPVGSSSSDATPSNRQCKSTNPSPTAATPISEPTPKRARHTADDDGCLQVQIKRCKHDVEGIQAEKEKIS